MKQKLLKMTHNAPRENVVTGIDCKEKPKANPCPFCGRKAAVAMEYGDFRVGCEFKGCRVRPKTEWNRKATVFAWWNGERVKKKVAT